MFNVIEFTEFNELEKFKEEMKKENNNECIEDYTLTRDSNEYSLILDCTRDIRYLINAGRCAYNNNKLEVIGQYESIQIVLHKLEKERVIRPYILGMIYCDLWNLREKCLYVQKVEKKKKEKELIIYSDYSLDSYIKYKSWEVIKESPANKLLKYIIKTNNSTNLIKELEKDFFLQEI